MNTGIIYRRYYNREENVMRRLQQLEKKTGYPMVQNNGQRVCGPPPGWIKPAPECGSEIFVGKLPRSLMEDELMEIFCRVGNIYKIRLMVDFNGCNRGFGFITYENAQQAKMAIELFNNYPIRPNRLISVFKSVDNRRLFIGGIPKDKDCFEVEVVLRGYVEELNTIVMYPPCTPQEGVCNRGYVFAEFQTHRAAAIARRLLNSGVKLWSDSPSPVSVDWADPIPEVDPRDMARVKRLYIRNLPYDLNSEQLQFYLTYNLRLSSITRVKKINDYAFVHFERKTAAEVALSVLNGRMIWGKELEVSWSRPQIYSKQSRVTGTPKNFCKSVPPRMRHKVQMLRNGPPQPPNSVSSRATSTTGTP